MEKCIFDPAWDGTSLPDSSSQSILPVPLKKRVLDYLKNGDRDVMADMALKDPFTGDVYERTYVSYSKDGFGWGTNSIYLLEKYDIKLADGFLKLFDVEA